MRVAVIFMLIAASAVSIGCRGRGSRGGRVVPTTTTTDDDGRPSSSGSGSLTNGEVCDGVMTAVCEWEIRCGAWSGTMSDCFTTRRYECCSGESCTWAAQGDAEQLRACEATIRGDSCEGFVSGPCEDLFGSGPDVDDPMTADAGRSDDSTLYGYCSSDSSCGPASEACFYVYGADTYDTTYMCTRRCDGEFDTTTCGTGAQCVEQPYDNPAVCMKQCTGDTDCPLELRCRALTSRPYSVCAP